MVAMRKKEALPRLLISLNKANVSFRHRLTTLDLKRERSSDER
jgi:hypothetical protein